MQLTLLLVLAVAQIRSIDLSAIQNKNFLILRTRSKKNQIGNNQNKNHSNMIYPILFVFLLLIVAYNSPLLDNSKFSSDLTNGDVAAMNAIYKEAIEWSIFWPGLTVGLKAGDYEVYKREGDLLKFMEMRFTAKGGEVIDLSAQDFFKWNETYVIYGTNLTRSSEKCFKNHLIAVIVILVAVSLVCCAFCVFACCYFKKRNKKVAMGKEE